MWDATQEAQGARARPAVTLVSVVSEDERHTRGHTSRRRGRARRDRQLGRVQQKVLGWLLAQYQHLERQGTDDDRRMLIRLGVPWLKVHEQIGERQPAVSDALQGRHQRSLEARRLVSVTRSSGGRTTHVKLTPMGRATAQVVQTHGEAAGSIEARVTEVFEERHGPSSGWSPAVRRAYDDQVEAVEDARRNASGVHGLHFVKMTDAELTDLHRANAKHSPDTPDVDDN